ncbi:MAG: HsdM family class I SAM-dependent methyltransferase [Promethearchaeota archaeon]|jgi:hypothetical protein
MSNNQQLNSDLVTALFGLNSDIYSDLKEFLRSHALTEETYESNFTHWKQAFKKIYGNKITSELFLEHTYFVLILKLLVFLKIGTKNKQSFKSIFDEPFEERLKALGIFQYSYFSWPHIDEKMFSPLFEEVSKISFAKQDILSQLYQHIFIPDIRHRGGEFYTPLHLTERMIQYVYKFGFKVLDPSCGSGNFLINIIINILNSQFSRQLKLKAISSVYGLDINPLAIITAKVNILLVLLDYFDIEDENFPRINIHLCDALFPNTHKTKQTENLSNILHSFDLVIGNPPWLTYKDLFDKNYQKKIRDLSDRVLIKPPSQYITHIELAAVFFYAIPLNFLKINGLIFFVMPKSVLNGDHCQKFRAFSIFNNELEIWDFPQNYFFNVNHICLKGEYIGPNNNISIKNHYPIKTKIFGDKLELKKETLYSSLNVEGDGAKLILPIVELEKLTNIESSQYKKKFYQGATLVPRTLVFFQISEEKKELLVISTDPDVFSRAKKKWEYDFQNLEIEKKFQFKTFLNKDLIPFHIKSLKDVFLPINNHFEFDLDYLKQYPKGYKFYNEVNDFYKKMKKDTSNIETLYDNLNYWNKLQKQFNTQAFTVVYNASGSNLKAAVIRYENQKIIVGSENYYYSTDSEEEAYYLSAILNSPELSKNIKLIKSSRHIHKRPFMFPIPTYDENNPTHRKLAKKGITCHGLVYELAIKNPKITSEKVRILINRKIMKIKELVEEIVFT